MENKEKQVISAIEPVTATISVDKQVHSIICQCCLLCGNSRPFINGYPPGPSPWVCDECREAIAFIKKQMNCDPLKPILD
jgi:hypothetical protein